MSLSSRRPWDANVVRAHTAGLQRLARGLVHDGAEAEDLVQATWFAFVRRPPRAQTNLGGWLAAVLRRIAVNTWRSDVRRDRRALAASAESAVEVEGPERALQLLNTQRLVAHLLSELSEPYRSTVLECYFHDVSPSQLASRLGIPAGTVRWRLKQALEQIRAELDRRHGGDHEAWMLALIDVARARTRASTARKKTVMSTKMKAVLFAGGLAAVSIITVAGRRARVSAKSGVSNATSAYASGDDEPGSVGVAPDRRRHDPPVFASASAPHVDLSSSFDDLPVPVSKRSGFTGSDYRKLARTCELRFELPGMKLDAATGRSEWMDERDLAQTSLSVVEQELVAKALKAYRERTLDQMRAVYVELVPDAKDADQLSIVELNGAIANRVGRRALAEALRAHSYRLAQLPAPEAASTAENRAAIKLYDVALQLGDTFRNELARDVGDHRADELMRSTSLPNRQSGCP